MDQSKPMLLFAKRILNPSIQNLFCEITGSKLEIIIHDYVARK